MARFILSIIFVLGSILGAATEVRAEQLAGNVESEVHSVSISVSESVLHVSGANGMILKVYNLAGVCVMSVKIDSQDKRYELNYPKGCYIVKVGKTVRKISIS